MSAQPHRSIPVYYHCESITDLSTWPKVRIIKMHIYFLYLLVLLLATVEPLNKGHFGSSLFVLYTKVVLARRLNNTTAICLVPSYVSIIGRLSLARRVLYWRFHCIAVFSLNFLYCWYHGLHGCRKDCSISFIHSYLFYITACHWKGAKNSTLETS